MYNFKNIREQRKDGKNFSEIARDLDLNRKTVRKYALSNTPPKYSPRLNNNKEDYFEPFKDIVIQKMNLAPNWTSPEIFAWIKAKGYKGSERTVYRRIQIIKGEKPKERYFEQEYIPGEQAQFDFKESVQVQFIEGTRLCHLFFGTLPYSNKCFVKSYPNKNYECYADGLHSFFEEIRGLPKILRIDNLTPCVKRILASGERIYTESFKRAIEYYGVEVSACTPGKGNEKGDVERDIRTYARRLINLIKVEGIVFHNFNHFNEFLKNYSFPFFDEVRYSEEIKHLNSMLPKDSSILCRIIEQKASSFGTVHISKEIYSVPDEAIGVNCKVIGGPYSVEVIRLDTKLKIAEHPRVSEGEKSVLLQHVLRSLIRKPRAMIHWDHKDILFPKPEFKYFYESLKKTQKEINPEKEYLMSLNLIQHTSLDEIAVGMSLIVEQGSEKMFEDLRELILGSRRPCNIFDISRLLGQKPLEPNLFQYDILVPKGGEFNKDSHPG